MRTKVLIGILLVFTLSLFPIYAEVILDQTYENKEEKFTFKYPKTWQQHSVVSESVIVLLLDPAKSDYPINMSIIAGPHNGRMLMTTKETLLKSYSKIYSDLTIDSFKDCIIAGKKGKRVASTYTEKGVKLFQLQYAYENDSKLYVITFTSSQNNRNKYEPIFEKIIAGYEINKNNTSIPEANTKPAQGRREASIGDFQFGPFMCGDKWDPGEAAKAFGAPIKETKVNFVKLNQYDITETYRKATAENSYNIRKIEGREISFNGITFIVIGGNVHAMVVSRDVAPTLRGLRIGDSLDKTMAQYGFLRPGEKGKTFSEQLHEPQNNKNTQDELYPIGPDVAGNDKLNYQISTLEKNNEKQICYMQYLNITIDQTTKKVIRMEFHQAIGIKLTEQIFPSSPYLAELKNRTSGTGKKDTSMPEALIGPFRIGDTFNDATIQKAKKNFGDGYKSKESGKTEKGNIIYQHFFYPPQSKLPIDNWFYVVNDKIVGICIEEQLWMYPKDYRSDMKTGYGLAFGDSIDKAVRLYGKPTNVTSPGGFEYSIYYYGKERKGMEIYFDELEKKVEMIYIFNYLDY